VALEIHEQEPDDDFGRWDHIVEAALSVTSGRIIVAGCTDYFPNAQRINVSPGTYRVRVSYGALDSLSQDGLGGHDHYRVQLWRAPSIAVRILKQRSTLGRGIPAVQTE
jgi:hypothetical protein